MEVSDLLIDDDTVEEVKQKGKTLLPWLPDPHTCECGAYCDSKTEYVANQAQYCDIWKCPECGKRYFRERI